MTPYREDGLLACCDCHVLHPVVTGSSTRPDEAMEDAIDTQNQFIASHASHRLARVHRSGTETRSDRPLWDPMATITFEVTDGHRTYVATSARRSIDLPRVYTFTPGTLEVRNAEVAIDDADLRRGLDLRFYPHAVRPTKVDRFITLLREVVSHIAPDRLDVAFDVADDPAVSIARMPDDVYQELLARCGEIFDTWELLQVHAFLHDNRDEDGLLALRVRREVRTLTAP